MATEDAHPELPLDPDVGPLHPLLLVLVALGGAAGTATRYAVGLALPSGTGFPRGTLLVNLVGCFVLGALLEALAASSDLGLRRRLRLMLGTGFCGGLTTYSTFAVEADLLVHHSRPGVAAAYVVVSVIGGLFTAALGVSMAARVRTLAAQVPE